METIILALITFHSSLFKMIDVSKTVMHSIKTVGHLMYLA